MKRAAVVTLILVLSGWAAIQTAERYRADRQRSEALELADQALRTGEGLAGQLRMCEADLDRVRSLR